MSSRRRLDLGGFIGFDGVGLGGAGAGAALTTGGAGWRADSLAAGAENAAADGVASGVGLIGGGMIAGAGAGTMLSPAGGPSAGAVRRKVGMGGVSGKAGGLA